MLNQDQNSKAKKYDLEERTAKFGEEIIEFCRNVDRDEISKVLIRQLVRSATSIGANYMEANGADSKKDFRHKINLCKKEAKETMHWLRMFAKAVPQKKDIIRKLWQEAHEIVLIFSSIVKNTKVNSH